MRRVLRADLLDFTADPGFALPNEATGVRWRPDHLVLIEDGRIHAVQPAAQAVPPGWQHVTQEDHGGRLLMPGFIDTHVHCPQLDVIASYGSELLDWLNTYTFPAERRYADPAVSREGAHRFLNALWAHGTTSAVVFPTVHKVSAQALFEVASAHEMLAHPHCVPGLGDGGAHYGAICDASYPTFMLTYWVRDRAGERMTLAEAVHMLSAKPARVAGLDRFAAASVSRGSSLHVLGLLSAALANQLRTAHRSSAAQPGAESLSA